MRVFARQKKASLLFSRPAFVVFVIILLIIIRGTWNIYQKVQETDENLIEAQHELALLKAREEELSGALSELQSERGIESEIRDKYSVKKEGEEVIIIVDESTSESPPNPINEEKKWYQKIFTRD